jgi:predicted ribosomally synthesized peptide with SipW-like signal peptide
MSDHRATRRTRRADRREARSHRVRARWFGRGRTRALLSLGAVFALGVTGTTAYWTDTATISAGTITAGSMDMQLSNNNSSWSAVGTGTGHTAGHIEVPDLTPSESYAFSLYIRNIGDADFNYTATVTRGTSPSWNFTGDPITVQFFKNASPTSDSSYPIQRTCSGGSSLGSAQTVTSGNNSVVPNPERLDQNAASQTLCVVVAMSSSAGNGNQGKQGQLRFDFSAVQVTS